MMRRVALILFALASGLAAHESPIDHVERELELSVKEGQLLLGYRLRYSERALLMQVSEMDKDADGRLSPAEMTAYFTAQAARLAELFTVQVDGHALKFQPAAAMRPDVKLTQTFQFTAPLPALSAGKHPGELIDGYSRMYPGAFRWRQPTVVDPKQTHVEPVTPAEASPHQQHPAWLELKFEIVVPE